MLLAGSVLVLPACQDNVDRVTWEDEKILEVVTQLACKLGTQQIISDLPAMPRALGAQSVGFKNKPHNIHFGIDFNQRPQRRARWSEDRICPTVRVVDDARIRMAFAHETSDPPLWNDFGKAFDGAQNLLRLSLPVYSPDGQRALLYTEGTCPFKCGAGFYNELEKSSTGWKITRSEIAWKS